MNFRNSSLISIVVESILRKMCTLHEFDSKNSFFFHKLFANYLKSCYRSVGNFFLPGHLSTYTEIFYAHFKSRYLQIWIKNESTAHILHKHQIHWLEQLNLFPFCVNSQLLPKQHNRKFLPKENEWMRIYWWKFVYKMNA